jgi:Sugar (and other) transporter.
MTSVANSVPSSATTHEPQGTHQPKKAAASGWIGSALEYYDFFIYATAASLIFPQIFFPSGNPTVAIIASVATYGVGYVSRPIGAFVLGHRGDTRGRKTVLIVCMFLMGFATMGVGLLPTYQQIGIWAPAMLVLLRLIQGFAVAGEISGASSMVLEHAPFGRRGFFASFTLQGVQAGQIMAAAIFGAAYAVQPAYGIGISKDLYLWIPVLGNILAVLVIPFVGNLSDRIGRRPPLIVGALGSGLLSFGYLYAISIHSASLAIVMSLLMWGIVYQGYNAVFSRFYPELFTTRIRVSAMAISQNIGTAITALLPALFTAVAPPGSANIPLVVGGITFGITVLVSIAALTARETYRIHMKDLGRPNAVPVPKAEYDRLRAEAMGESGSHAGATLARS